MALDAQERVVAFIGSENGSGTCRIIVTLDAISNSEKDTNRRNKVPRFTLPPKRPERTRTADREPSPARSALVPRVAWYGIAALLVLVACLRAGTAPAPPNEMERRGLASRAVIPSHPQNPSAINVVSRAKNSYGCGRQRRASCSLRLAAIHMSRKSCVKHVAP